MSKAFTKEDDTAGPEAPVVHLGIPVPVGLPNYVTAAGALELRAELAALQSGERDAAGEARSHELADHLASAEIVEPSATVDRVGFGCTVTLEDEEGERHTYRLVGAIEAAPKSGSISYHSPIARALDEARVGDTVTLPKGPHTVVAIR